jgi:hypothetical protein
MSVLAPLWEAIPANSIENCWNKSTAFDFDPAGAFPIAPVAATAPTQLSMKIMMQRSKLWLGKLPQLQDRLVTLELVDMRH